MKCQKAIAIASSADAPNSARATNPVTTKTINVFVRPNTLPPGESRHHG